MQNQPLNHTPPADVIMLINPYTGQLVNLSPLLELMSEGAITQPGPRDVACQLQDVHDFISINIAPSPDGNTEQVINALRQISFTLIRIRKAFERMEPNP